MPNHLLLFDKNMALKITEVAVSYLGRKYTNDFNCMTFAREVYKRAGCNLPPLNYNITSAQLENPPVGYVIYLKHKNTTTRKSYTHAALLMAKRKCIHCSYYFGGKVVVTDLDQLLKFYDLVELR